MTLQGKRILITGASSGLGREVAKRASELGASLMLVSRNAKRNDTGLGLSGSNHQAVDWDLSDLGSLETLSRVVLEGFGSLDGVVHAAGVLRAEPFRLAQSDSFEQLFTLNMLAPTFLTRSLISDGVLNPGASVVFFGTVAAARGEPGLSAYSTSKAGLSTLSRVLTAELSGRRRYRFNTVACGLVATPMTDRLQSLVGSRSWQDLEKRHPLGIGRPSDVSPTVTFLLSDDARWITGADIVVDGGFSA